MLNEIKPYSKFYHHLIRLLLLQGEFKPLPWASKKKLHCI